MMSEKQFKELAQKMDILIKLTALSALKEKSKTEQIGILSELGLRTKEIVLIVGTTEGYVQTAKKRLRKRGKVKGGETCGENPQENISSNMG